MASNDNNNKNKSSLYPTIDPVDLANDDDDAADGETPVEEVLVRVPAAILNLVDKDDSIELSSGELTVSRVRQGPTAVAVVARVGDVQWPLARDAPAVKLDAAHYFFTIRDPSDSEGSSKPLSYGLTFPVKGQEKTLNELDEILKQYTDFSEKEVRTDGSAEGAEILDGSVERDVAAEDVAKGGKEKEKLRERSAAYWTALAPNVEEYSSSVARAIAKGSGQIIRGIVWGGDVTVERLKWVDETLKNKIKHGEKPAEISPDAKNMMNRVKRVTEMSENVVNGLLSGVVRVTGFFTSSIANSAIGRKFFQLLPGEIVLASLDGFEKIWDAVEQVGKNVLGTSSVVTTGLVSHRYGEQAAELTNEGLDAAGHAIGAAWAIFKIRKAVNPKSVIRPGTLARARIAEMTSNKSS